MGTQGTLSEQKINQIHEELLKKEDDKKKEGMFDRIPYESRKWLGLGIAAVLYYVYRNDVDLGKGILILGGALLIMFIFTQGGSKESRLTEQECAISLYKKLLWKQQYLLGKQRQLPKGEIFIDIAGKERWIEGKPWKREIGFYIIPYNTKLIKHYSAEIDVWSGDIICIRNRVKRYTGSESPDLRYIASLDLQKEKRYHEFGGKFYSGGKR